MQNNFKLFVFCSLNYLELVEIIEWLQVKSEFQKHAEHAK